MDGPTPLEDPVIWTTILDATAATSDVQLWPRQKEAKIRAGVWIWWTDGSRADNGRVGATAVCDHGHE